MFCKSVGRFTWHYGDMRCPLEGKAAIGLHLNTAS